MNGCVIGIDIGTTSVKAVAFDERGNEISRASQTVELLNDDSGMAEQDVRAVYELVTDAFVKTVTEAKHAGYTPLRVGFSTAMHSLLLVQNDGTPLTRAITWMDVRAKEDAEKLWNSDIGKSLYQRTGTPTHPMTPLSKLLWLQRTDKGLYDSADKFVSIKEWIWYAWFGEWCVDESMAGATGLYHMERHDWDEDALRLTGLTEERLSRIVPTTYVCVNVRDPKLLAAGVTKDTQFNIGASDGVLANLGVGSMDPDTMAMTIGTSCAIRMGSTRPVTDLDTRCFCYVLAPERYIVGGPSNSGGVVLDWLYRHVLSPNTEVFNREFEQLISEAGDVSIDDLYCLPYLTGERAPLWNADAKASFVGLQLHHGRNHLMRAAVEGIIFNAYWIAHRLMDQLGKPKTLIVSGKLLREKWVSQIVANVFGLPVRYTDVDASVLGAVTLANVACGAWTWEDARAHTGQLHGDVVEPDLSKRDGYADKFDTYRSLCHKLLLA